MLSHSAAVAVVFAVLSFVKQQPFVVASANDVGREEKGGDMSKRMYDEEPRMVAMTAIEVKNSPRPNKRKIRGSKFGRISSKKDVPSRRLQTCDVNGTFTPSCEYNVGGEDDPSLDCNVASFEDDLAALVESDASFCRGTYFVQVTLQNNGDDYTINSLSASPQFWIFPTLPDSLGAGMSENYFINFLDSCFCQESPQVNFTFQGVALATTDCPVSFSTPPVPSRPPMCDAQITMQTFGCNQNGAAIDCSSIQTPTTQADCNVTIENIFMIENLGIINIDNITITSSIFQCCDGTGSCVDGTGMPNSNMVPAMQSTQASLQCTIDICGSSSRFDLLTSIGAQAENVCTPTDPGPMCSTTNTTEFDFGFDCFPLIDITSIGCIALPSGVPCDLIPNITSESECEQTFQIEYTLQNIPQDIKFSSVSSQVCYLSQQDCEPVSMTAPMLTSPNTVAVNNTVNVCSEQPILIEGEVFFEINNQSCSKNASRTIPPVALSIPLSTECRVDYFLGIFPRFIYFFSCLIFNFFIRIEIQVCQVEFIGFIPNLVSFAFCKIIQITRFVVVTIFGVVFGN